MKKPEEIKKGLECCKYGLWTVIEDKGWDALDVSYWMPLPEEPWR